MPKKKRTETAEEQAARFKAAIQMLVDAGELDPAEADAAFNRAMNGVVKLRQEWFDEEEGQENPS